MSLFFAAQRAASGARIFSRQAGNSAAPVDLVIDPLVMSGTTITTGGLREVLVLIDQPAPRGRCIFLDRQNRTIRL